MSIPYCEFFLNNHGVYIMMPLELTVVEIARAECQHENKMMCLFLQMEMQMKKGQGFYALSIIIIDYLYCIERC